MHLLQQRDMRVFGKVPLAASDDNPGYRQRPTLIDHTEHQRHTPAPDCATIHYQHQRPLCQTGQHGLGKWQKVGLHLDPLVVDPPREPLDPTLSFRAVRCFLGDGRKVSPMAADDAANQSGQGIQVPRQVPGWLSRVQLLQGCPNSTISACIVAHGILLTEVSVEACHDFG
jgi:hypothetical protein